MHSTYWPQLVVQEWKGEFSWSDYIDFQVFGNTEIEVLYSSPGHEQRKRKLFKLLKAILGLEMLAETGVITKQMELKKSRERIWVLVTSLSSWIMPYLKP